MPPDWGGRHVHKPPGPLRLLASRCMWLPTNANLQATCVSMGGKDKYRNTTNESAAAFIVQSCEPLAIP